MPITIHKPFLMINIWLFIPLWMGGSFANPFSGWRSYMTLCLLSSRLACHLHMSTAERVEMTESVPLIISYKTATLCQSFVIIQKKYGRFLWKSTCNFVIICLWPSNWKVCWAGYKILGSHFLLLNILLHCFLLWCGIVEKSDANLIFFPW